MFATVDGEKNPTKQVEVGGLSTIICKVSKTSKRWLFGFTGFLVAIKSCRAPRIPSSHPVDAFVASLYSPISSINGAFFIYMLDDL